MLKLDHCAHTLECLSTNLSPPEANISVSMTIIVTHLLAVQISTHRLNTILLQVSASHHEFPQRYLFEDGSASQGNAGGGAQRVVANGGVL